MTKNLLVDHVGALAAEAVLLQVLLQRFPDGREGQEHHLLATLVRHAVPRLHPRARATKHRIGTVTLADFCYRMSKKSSSLLSSELRRCPFSNLLQ